MKLQPAADDTFMLVSYHLFLIQVEISWICFSRRKNKQKNQHTQTIMCLLYFFSSSKDTPAPLEGMLVSTDENNVSNMFIEDEIRFIHAEAQICASELG